MKAHHPQLASGIQAYKAGDYKKALKIFKPLAEQGGAAAQLNLGNMYLYGEGVPQDYAEAVKWYRIAAEQGDAEAQAMLGIMYLNGEGVPQDNVQALKWLNLSASRSQGKDHDYAVDRRIVTEKKMTPTQVVEAQKLAREWKPNKLP